MWNLLIQFSSLVPLTYSSTPTLPTDPTLYPVKTTEEGILSLTLDNLILNYDRRIRPNHGGPPVIVNISMYLISILHVSEVNMEFQTDLYFRQGWTDHRLDFTRQPQFRQNDTLIPEFLRLDPEHGKGIWTPDTFFPNEKFAHIHSATKLNEFVWIWKGGKVLKSIRLTLGITCPMQLQYFPMDTQLCTIKIDSYGYTADDLILRWDETTRILGSDNDDIQSVDFRVVGYRLRSKSFSMGVNNYSTLSCDIQLSRSMGFYLMQIYVPSALLVVLSWFPMWMGRSYIIERMSLNVTTIFTITMLLAALNATAPKIPYVKAIDVYVGICFSFVFAGLIESATVGYFTKRVKGGSGGRESLRSINKRDSGNHGKIWGRGRPWMRLKNSLQHPRTTTMVDNNGLELTCRENGKVENIRNSDWRKGDGERMGRRQNNPSLDLPVKMDMTARILFPVSFLVVNVVYWLYYLQASKVVTEGLIYWKN